MSKIINRYKFSNLFINSIKLFCENNKFIDNDNFKKKYQLWKIENSIAITCEKDLLLSNGYTGNFENKLNKAILYYFKYNFTSKAECENECEFETRFANIIKRQYLTFDFEFLQLIDAHIYRHFNSENKIKGKLLFEEFKILNLNKIFEQKDKLKYILCDEKILDQKVKKTYQNRYYNINKKI